jgi:hypothetical protein
MPKMPHNITATHASSLPQFRAKALRRSFSSDCHQPFAAEMRLASQDVRFDFELRAIFLPYR